MVRVEQRIDGGQLRMRDAESSLKNLKEQARAKGVLWAYHPFWLRLGMEIVAGRAVASESRGPGGGGEPFQLGLESLALAAPDPAAGAAAGRRCLSAASCLCVPLLTPLLWVAPEPTACSVSSPRVGPLWPPPADVAPCTLAALVGPQLRVSSLLTWAPRLSAAGGEAVVTAGDLEAFLREQFMRDPVLARRHAPNRAVTGLYPQAYWVGWAVGQQQQGGSRVECSVGWCLPGRPPPPLLREGWALRW